MADLGAKGYVISPRTRSIAVPVISPAIYKRPSPFDLKETEFDLSGVISGVVVINGVPQARVRVALLHRSNLNVIALTHTDGAGAYVFKFLDITDLKNYITLFVDPNDEPVHNYTLARDHLSPG